MNHDLPVASRIRRTSLSTVPRAIANLDPSREYLKLKTLPELKSVTAELLPSATFIRQTLETPAWYLT
jgi:hypothetical protein